MQKVNAITRKEIIQLQRLLNDVYKFFQFLGLKDVYIHVHFQKICCNNIFAQSYIGQNFNSEVTKDKMIIENGIIRLTDLFFKLKRVERISVLIHEIIHLADKSYALTTMWKYSTMVDHIRAEILASAFEYLWLRVYNKMDEKEVVKFLEGVYQDLYNSYFKGFCSYQMFVEWFMRAVKRLAVLVIKNGNVVFAFTEAEQEAVNLLKVFGVKSYDDVYYIR